MAEPEVAGTPKEPAGGGNTAGTTGAPADGGLMAGLTPDQKALFMAQEKKAEEGNKALKRAAELEARLAEIERQQYQQQPQSAWAELNQRAAYGDAEALAQVNNTLMSAVAVQQAEHNLLQAMVRNGVKPDMWDTVAGLVRQSGYRMDVANAMDLARGKEAPVLQEQLKAQQEEIRRLKETLDARTVNGTGQRVSVSTPAAAVTDDFSDGEMDADEYVAIMRAGGERADKLRSSNVKLRRKAL